MDVVDPGASVCGVKSARRSRTTDPPSMPSKPSRARRRAHRRKARPSARRAPLGASMFTLSSKETTRLYAGMAALVLFAGALLRLLYLGEIPDGLQHDEASIGYETWSLLKHGIDRNGYPWPVHFVSWASGQNALYAYLSLPIIAAFDLTIFSTRLLMALAGVASLWLFWRVAARAEFAAENDQRMFALLALTLLAFCPWHIVTSRWAIESNFLPFVILLAVYFFARTDNHRLRIQAAGVFVLSLSVYAYGAAYLFAPLFLALTLGWLWLQGKLPLRNFLLLCALSLATALPIILLVAINTFDWEAIVAGISIPKYTGIARYEDKSTLFGGRFLAHLGEQWLFITKLLTLSDPPVFVYPQNRIPGFALLFPLASVPLVVGFGVTIYRALKHREIGVHLLLALWLIAALVTAGVVVAGVHRVNVVWLPAVYFAALGVFTACRRWRALPPLAVAAAMLYGGWFANYYFTRHNDDWRWPDHRAAFTHLLQDAADDDPIYITRLIHEPYIHALFHSKTPPQEFIETRDILDPGEQFPRVLSFGRFIFDPARMDKAAHFLLQQNRNGELVGEPEEIAALNAADLSACARENHGDFVVLSCQ